MDRSKIIFRNYPVGSQEHEWLEASANFLEPLFDDNTLCEFPGADYYAIAYENLCAYSFKKDKYNHDTLLAIWTTWMPDCPEHMRLDTPHSEYKGTWKLYRYVP